MRPVAPRFFVFVASLSLGACTLFDSAAIRSAMTDAGEPSGAAPSDPTTDDRSIDPSEPDASVDASPDATMDAVADGQPIKDAAADAACSVSSDIPVSFEVTNTGTTPLNLFWVDYGCLETFYGVIPVGGSLGFGSFTTHGWRVRDAMTAVLVREIILGTTNVSVSVP